MSRTLGLVILLLVSLAPATSVATEAGWALLRTGGQIVLLRHARAPGTGDPANFDIDKCATQRNLSEQGRLQARRIGALIAARAAPTERVLSSRYCRAKETAALVFGAGSVELFEPLDPSAGDDNLAKERAAAVMEAIRAYSGSGNFYLVTHDTNIKALTGHTAREGEAVIVVPNDTGLTMIGKIVFN
ncbi:MAG: histidine phosphatase family protein [Rhizobiaceae bacterium]|nr:histidine phosphatase family protein [Rhizobiaceae bacterium]